MRQENAPFTRRKGSTRVWYDYDKRARISRHSRSEREQLLNHRRQLKDRVAVLESALSDTEKQAFGVGD